MDSARRPSAFGSQKGPLRMSLVLQKRTSLALVAELQRSTPFNSGGLVLPTGTQVPTVKGEGR